MSPRAKRATRPAASTWQEIREDRWLALLTMTRLLGATVAVILLLAHHVTDHDPRLAAVAAGWTAVTLVAFGSSPALRASPVAWGIDMLAAMALVLASADWRSPFYVFALTTLVLPTTGSRWRGAVAWGAAFSVLYACVAFLERKVPSDTLMNTIRLETLATHLFVPIVIAMALGYASELLRRLRDARAQSERLVLQAERQRIAWELHDSAKQRVHAAHLMLTALDGAISEPQHELVDHVLSELRAATADMETSVAELRTPLDGRPVDELLRERARELEPAGRARITVEGRLPHLPPLIAAHAYRIAAEALINAVRHADCSQITVTMADGPDGAEVVIDDDGVGMAQRSRLASHGLRSMQGRAETIGATLDIGPRPGGGGTRVALALPHHNGGSS
ncbi:MAG TPA: ATP-binding protein [Baekduia sp.]|nr:ATP-binding protein [Baekduia sp.]